MVLKSLNVARRSQVRPGSTAGHSVASGEAGRGIVDEFLKARTSSGLTQADLAERMGTTQSAVARLESPANGHLPSVATLERYARALGYRLQIRLVQDKTPDSDKNCSPECRRALRVDGNDASITRNGARIKAILAVSSFILAMVGADEALAARSNQAAMSSLPLCHIAFR